MPAGATGGVRLTGQWDRFLRALDPDRFERAMRREVRRATLLNALLVQREIRNRIREGRYAENSPLTLAAKAPKTKPLVVTGNLFGAITHQLASDYLAFVGLKFGARSSEGTDLVNVGLALHEGFTLQVTPAMRRAVFAKIGRNRSRAKAAHLAKIPGTRLPDGSMVPGQAADTWVIPARPFVQQVIGDPAIQRQIRANWEQATARAIASL